MKKFQKKAIYFLLIAGFLFSYFSLGAAPSLAASLCSCSLVGEEAQGIAAIKNVVPSVVSIIVSKQISKINRTTGETYFEKKEMGRGTGFIVSPTGLILTNRHLAGDRDAEYKVFLNDNRRFTGKIADIDKLYDLSLLKIDAKNLPVLKLGDSDSLEVGRIVLSIGNTLGQYQNSVTKGIISGIGRSLSANDNITGQTEQLDDVIQTDAAINPGNSGGPLVNLKGEAIGINTAVESFAQSLGFAIPINAAKKVVSTYEKYGKIQRPFLGVRYMMITPDLKEEQNLSLDYGALIMYGDTEAETPIAAGSPAEKAGLGAGDIIIEINAIKLKGENSLVKVLQRYKVGDKIGMKVWRSGRVIMRTVTLDELK
jgi:serine protease Do